MGSLIFASLGNPFALCTYDLPVRRPRGVYFSKVFISFGFDVVGLCPSQHVYQRTQAMHQAGLCPPGEWTAMLTQLMDWTGRECASVTAVVVCEGQAELKVTLKGQGLRHITSRE